MDHRKSTMIPRLSEKVFVGFDPGETTGYCIIQGSTLILGAELSFNQMLSFKPTPAYIWTIERWSLYPHMARTMIHNEFLPVQVIGMIRLRAKEINQRLEFNPASNVKKFVTDELLKKYNFYNNLSPHIRDAIRHAVYESIKAEREGVKK